MEKVGEYPPLLWVLIVAAIVCVIWQIAKTVAKAVYRKLTTSLSRNQAFKDSVKSFRANDSGDKEKREFGSLMIERARETGPVFVMNVERSVVGVTTHKIFAKKYAALLRELESSGDAGLVTPVVVCVFPTYTFWMNPDSHILMHTGDSKQFDFLCGELVKAVTGVSRSEVGKKDFETALEIIMPRDGHLFVPFVPGKSLERSRELGYVRRSFADAHSVLLHSIPQPYYAV